MSGGLEVYERFAKLDQQPLGCGKGRAGGWPRLAHQSLLTRVPRSSFAWAGASCYPSRMAKSKNFDLENPAPVVDDEDEQTLAAIDEGMRDVEAGRTVPAEEVRRLLPKWTTASSTRKRH